MGPILVTGGAGFIGSAFIRHAKSQAKKVVVLDALTYAGHLPNIQDVLEQGRVEFVKGDIGDPQLVAKLLSEYKFAAVINFAAESHVDRSIHGPEAFIKTNIAGTFNLLNCSLQYYTQLTSSEQKEFRFLQVSTDEVFGELGKTGYFTEESRYQPNSPYSASKAAADHLVRAWYHTYGLPTLITNCSNNYGPRQYPEKLIPVMIQHCLTEKPLPVYGDGSNVRDWIHVEDHAAGVWLALSQAAPGESFCFGGRAERDNLTLVQTICKILDEIKPRPNAQPYSDLITFVQDRAGHDWRYAIDDSKAERELGFQRKYTSFEDGLRATIQWYLDNPQWTQSVLEKAK